MTNTIDMREDHYSISLCNVAPDPLLTQNPKKAGRAGRKQRKIRRMNGGKKHKSEPK